MQKQIDWIGTPLISQCSLRGIYFAFSSLTQRQNVTPTHIAHIGKASRAYASTKASPKSAILLTQSFVFGEN